MLRIRPFEGKTGVAKEEVVSSQWTVKSGEEMRVAETAGNPNGIPSLSPGLADEIGLPWVNDQNNPTTLKAVESKRAVDATPLG